MSEQKQPHIPGFELIEPLGRGGMGEVWLARQDSLQREVAIKLIREGYAENPEFIERFKLEAQAAANLDHPNIISIHDFGTTPELCYQVMPYLRGGSLRERLGKLDVLRSVDIIRQLADALAHAHEQRMVHRDIKPGNILFDQRDTPILADFGIVKLLESDADLTRGQTLGSPRYMSPEQEYGKVDKRSDIFSLGLVFYSMLAGKPPGESGEPLKKKDAESCEKIISECRTNPVSAPFTPLLMRMIAHDPNERYQNLGEFIEALDKVTKDLANAANTETGESDETVPREQPAGRKEESMPKMLNFIKNHKIAVTINGLLLVLALVLAWYFLDLVDELSLTKTQLRLYEEDIARLNSENARLQREKIGLNQSITRLGEIHNATLAEERRILEQEIIHLRENHDITLEEAQRIRNALQQEKNRLEERVEDLENSLKAKGVELAERDETIAALTTERDALQTKLNETRENLVELEQLASMPPAGQTFRDCPECPEMVTIPAGRFEMGSPEDDDDRHDSEGPLRTVTFDRPFALGTTPVTQAQWRAVMGDNPSRFDGCDDCPVESVNWHDAQAYIRTLNERTGRNYRLPSEAEWEYACRAGERHRYCGSDDIDAVAWYLENSDGRTRPVAGKQANAWGLYDMSGNVWEWTQDCWNGSYRGAPDDGRAWESGDCDRRVVRGGSWGDLPHGVRSAVRFWNLPGLRDVGLGLRLARSP